MIRLFILIGVVNLLFSGGLWAKPLYLKTIPKFWEKLYPNGGYSLYCDEKFGRFNRTYNIEHVYPMSWVGKALNCGSRKQCRKKSRKYNQIESDMHNMWPSRSSINKARGSYAFDEIPGEKWHKSSCDFELDRSKKRVEPRPEVRGDIARTMLYMADKWRLPIYRWQEDVLQKWNREDPVSEEERRRNRIIQRVQGRRNHWIK